MNTFISMCSINDYIDRIYVITLDNAKERHEHIEYQLAKHNIKAEIQYNAKPKKGRAQMAVGQYGCHLSHKRAIKSFIDSRTETCLILEDDVVFCEDFNERFCEFYNEFQMLDKPYNVLALGYDVQGDISEHQKIHNNIYKLRHCWAGQSYILNRKSAQKLHLLYNRKIWIADWYLAKDMVKGDGIYAPYPALTKQALFSTSVLTEKSPLSGYVQNQKSTWVNIHKSYQDIVKK